MKKIKINHNYLFFVVLSLLLLIIGIPFCYNYSIDKTMATNVYYTYGVHIRSLTDDQLRKYGNTIFDPRSDYTLSVFDESTQFNDKITSKKGWVKKISGDKFYEGENKLYSTTNTETLYSITTHLYTFPIFPTNFTNFSHYYISLECDPNYSIYPSFARIVFFNNNTRCEFSTTFTLSIDGGSDSEYYGVVITPRVTDLELVKDGSSTYHTSYYSKTWDFFKPIRDPIKEGHNFNGWSTSSSASSGISSSTLGTYDSDDDDTYYATWSKKQYYVDINILSPSGKQDYNSGTMTQTYGSRSHTGNHEGFDNIMYGDSWTISNITPAPGMALESVYLDNGNGTLVNNGNGTWTFTMNKDSGGNVINIKMRYKNYPIQYLSGYGTNSIVGNSSVTYGSNINLLGTQTRDGYVFLNWLCNKDSKEYGEGVSYTPGDYPEDPNDPITFTAQWRSKKYNVYYNDGYSDEENEYDKLIYYENGTYKLRDRPPRTGYTFTGWLCSADGEVYDSGATYNIPHNLDDEADITFTAQWTENKYTIVYNGNGSTGGSMDNTSMIYNTAKNLTKNGFTKTGYVFLYWTDSNGNKYYDEQSVNNLTATNNGTVTFYAQWQATWATQAKQPNGSGTEESPYRITTANELAWIASQNKPFNGIRFKLMNDIDLSSTTYKWLPIGSTTPFQGIFIGNGFTISGFQTTDTKHSNGKYLYSNQGLFGQTNGATIENLRITNATIYGNTNVGIIVGAVSSATTVRYCVVENSTVSASSTNGMIIGNSAGSISCCLVKSSNATTRTLGGSSQSSCLFDINGTRSQTSSFDLSAWGKVGNELLPAGYSWIAGASPVKQADINDWINKKLGN